MTFPVFPITDDEWWRANVSLRGERDNTCFVTCDLHLTTL